MLGRAYAVVDRFQPRESGKICIDHCCRQTWHRTRPTDHQHILGTSFFIEPIDGSHKVARIRKIVFDPPEDLRDFVWLPARFTWSNDGEAVGFVPTRYPGSEHGDASARLARGTEWHAVGDIALGRGQRMFATDGDDIGLLEAREIELDLPAADGGDG